MENADSDYKQVRSRLIPAPQLKGVISQLCKEFYFYDGRADPELRNMSSRVRAHLESLAEADLAYEYCITQFYMARNSGLLDPTGEFNVFLHCNHFGENYQKVLTRLRERGFEVNPSDRWRGPVNVSLLTLRERVAA